MTANDIAALVDRELAAFRYEAPAPGSGLLGTPWPVERVTRGVQALRAALVLPRRVSLTMRDFHGTTEVREGWVVALADEYLVIYDPAAAEFGLAQANGDADATDINVRGDLIGTFLAA